jgi:hypothetical protein
MLQLNTMAKVKEGNNNNNNNSVALVRKQTIPTDDRRLWRS